MVGDIRRRPWTTLCLWRRQPEPACGTKATFLTKAAIKSLLKVSIENNCCPVKKILLWSSLAPLAVGGLIISGGLNPAQAYTNTLTFSGLGLSNASLIPQSYGDVPGVVNISYRSVFPFGSNDTFTPDLSYWNDLYSDLTDIAYSPSSDSTGTGEVAILPAAGYKVKLLGFDLGSWPNLSRTSQAAIYDGTLSTQLLDYGTFTVSGITASSFAPNLQSSNGLRIQWGPSAFNVGIDNISYELTPIDPITSSVPGPLPALGVAAGFGYSRKLRSRIKKSGNSASSTFTL